MLALTEKKMCLCSGAEHVPIDYTAVPAQMKKLITHYFEKWKHLHPAERSALLHIEFVKIHPFVDGNGRTARLLQNFRTDESRVSSNCD